MRERSAALVGSLADGGGDFGNLLELPEGLARHLAHLQRQEITEVRRVFRDGVRDGQDDTHALISGDFRPFRLDLFRARHRGVDVGPSGDVDGTEAGVRGGIEHVAPRAFGGEHGDVGEDRAERSFPAAVVEVERTERLSRYLFPRVGSRERHLGVAAHHREDRLVGVGVRKGAAGYRDDVRLVGAAAVGYPSPRQPRGLRVIVHFQRRRCGVAFARC
mmetsp:Transcript_10236/g.44506  ORF Transcript_10236/g.44506 Transcript_10236/m.44506 type:complete len:218 (-) Transcript_10236:180-833(-)